MVTRSEFQRWIESANFDDLDLNHDDVLSRTELATWLSERLKREATTAELDMALQVFGLRLQHDIPEGRDAEHLRVLGPRRDSELHGNGPDAITRAAWRRAGGGEASGAEVVAGSLRATVISCARTTGHALLRILPRMPAVQFFKPKARNAEGLSGNAALQKEVLNTLQPGGQGTAGVVRAGGFMLSSMVAGSAMFAVYRTVTTRLETGLGGGVENLPKPAGADVVPGEDGGGMVAAHFVGGAAGGALHAALISPFLSDGASSAQRPAADGHTGAAAQPQQSRMTPVVHRLRNAGKLFPRVLRRDTLAYSSFFGVYKWTHVSLPCAAREPTARLFDFDSVTRSATAGAAAGAAFHVAHESVDLAHRDGLWAVASLRSAARTLLHAGPALGMGAVTFTVYEHLIMFLERDRKCLTG